MCGKTVCCVYCNLGIRSICSGYGVYVTGTGVWKRFLSLQSALGLPSLNDALLYVTSGFYSTHTRVNLKSADHILLLILLCLGEVRVKGVVHTNNKKNLFSSHMHNNYSEAAFDSSPLNNANTKCKKHTREKRI